ncbi:MAG: hypothetical protein Q8K32_30910 [Archangium sp.]|nr:hypothetical protein [Archangium sp.]
MAVFSFVATIAGLLAIIRVLPRDLALLWPLGFFSGLMGLVLSIQELGAIARGDSPAAGRRLARMARTVSFVHAEFIAVFFMGIFVVGFMEGSSRFRAPSP